MSRKLCLTKDFVDAARPPATGELWFPDTKVRGFGLRLWAGKKGGGAAYCLRAKDAEGRWTRRQYERSDPLIEWRLSRRSDETGPPSLGDYLDSARQWARDETLHLQGRLTERELKHRAHEARRAEMAVLPFGEVLRGYLTDGPGKRFGDSYREMITVAMLNFIPQALQQTPFGAVQARDFIEAIIAPDRPPAVVNALRAYVSKVAKSDYTAGAGWVLGSGGAGDPYWEIASDVWPERWKAEHAAIKALIPAVMAYLEAQPVASVSAAFLRLYFATGAKQSPLLQATWAQLELRFLPEGRSFYTLQGHRILPEDHAFLQGYRQALQAEFGEAEWMFPSKAVGGEVRPITSVQRAWRAILRGIGADHALQGDRSLHRFAMIASLAGNSTL